MGGTRIREYRGSIVREYKVSTVRARMTVSILWCRSPYPRVGSGHCRSVKDVFAAGIVFRVIANNSID